MSTGSNYETGIVIVNRHEPDHEVATRLIELAREKGYDERVVEAQRGEHDAALGFRAPVDVVDAFSGERADRWSADKIENDAEKAADQRALPSDAYAADYYASADQARADNASRGDSGKKTTTSARTTRPEKPKE